MHRPDGHRTWVWSDLHLRHANIIKHCKRPFANARDMDRTMMTAWKSVVGTDDTVLNGGDVALAGSLGESGRARIREAPGHKILVVGNHDFNRKTGLLDAAGHGIATGILAIDTDPPMVLDAHPDGRAPAGLAKPVRPRAQQRTASGDAAHQPVRRAHRLPTPPAREPYDARKDLLVGHVPDGATTGDRIQSAKGTNR